MIHYKHDMVNNKIIFDKPIKKGRNNIKVYFHRPVDESETYDYPVCTANGTGKREYDWVPGGFEVMGITIRRPRFFGLLGSRWEEAIKIINELK